MNLKIPPIISCSSTSLPTMMPMDLFWKAACWTPYQYDLVPGQQGFLSSFRMMNFLRALGCLAQVRPVELPRTILRLAQTGAHRKKTSDTGLAIVEYFKY